MWADESAKWCRAVLCSLRGTEAFCWQNGDLTDCIVHTLPVWGTTFFFNTPIPPLQPPCRRPALPSLNLQPCQLHPPPSPSPVAISASPYPAEATCLPPRPSPTPRLLLRLPLATRHSQMSAGSCITETARLSAVVTWHLKAVRAWDTVASHSTLIAVYWLLEDSSENKVVEWYHRAKGCFLTFLCVCYQINVGQCDYIWK